MLSAFKLGVKDWWIVNYVNSFIVCPSLHWLLISQRITFKIALMMFDCSRGRCLKYFGDVFTPVHTVAAVHDCDQPTTVMSSTHVHGPLGLAAAVSACADQQSLQPKLSRKCYGTNCHRLCEAQTLGNSLNVALRAGYLSVRTTGGVSDRRWLKAHLTSGLLYLLISSCMLMLIFLILSEL